MHRWWFGDSDWVNPCDEDPWWAAVDSNHLPPRYQHGALPVELAAHGLSKRIAPGETDEAELYHGHEPALSGSA